MHDFKHMNSLEDNSVNFVFPKNKSNIESRFVKRNDDYFICYLSSQNGCQYSCRFCHLTQSKQTEFDQTTLEEFHDQTRVVLDHYRSTYPTEEMTEKAIYFNFMARGEPLVNPHVHHWLELRRNLIDIVDDYCFGYGWNDFEFKFKLSTIIPESIITLNQYLLDDTYIYYSLYSLDPHFRKRWLPKAKDVNESLELLKDFQDKGGNIVFHWAFIEDENDSVEDVKELAYAVRKFKNPRINIVRYNPYSSNQGKESKYVHQNAGLLQDMLGNEGRVKVIQRVGYDVKASCGMFV